MRCPPALLAAHGAAPQEESQIFRTPPFICIETAVRIACFRGQTDNVVRYYREVLAAGEAACNGSVCYCF